jgi:hypothetical protein
MENKEITILSHGDEIERDNWELLKAYIHRYETVWRLLVVPLRSAGSIYLRDGLDEALEEFAMSITRPMSMSHGLRRKLKPVQTTSNFPKKSGRTCIELLRWLSRPSLPSERFTRTASCQGASHP